MKRLAAVLGIAVMLVVLPALTSADTDVVEAPKLLVGDRWERSNGRVYEVIGEEGGLYVVRRTKGGQITEELWDKAALSLIKWREPGKELKPPSTNPTVQHLLFPLTVGKKWDLWYRHISLNANFQRWYKVEAWEEVKVPAGTFKALRIRSDGRRIDSGYQFTEIYWYSPDVRGLGKSTSDVQAASAREPMEFELLKFTPGAPKVSEAK